MSILNRPLSPRVESSLTSLAGMKAATSRVVDNRKAKLMGAPPVVIVTGQDKPKD